MHRRGRLVLALSVIAALSATPVRGQTLYRYVDEHGGVHFVDSPSKVPPSRRSTAAEVSGDPGHVPLQPSPSTPPPGEPGRPERIERIERSSDASHAAPDSCRLIFRNRRSRVDGTRTIYSGEVVNAGTGTARGVEVAFVDYDEADRVMDRRTVTPVPSTLASRQSGAFTLEMKTVERTAAKTQARFARTAFEATFVRCD